MNEEPSLRPIYCTDTASLFIDLERNLWVCGSFGDRTDDFCVPRIVFPTILRKIHRACLGQDHAVFLDAKGNAWSCGSNSDGQLGIRTTELAIPRKISSVTGVSMIATGKLFSLFLDFNGVVYSCGNNQYGQLGLGDEKNKTKPRKIPNLPEIFSVYAGASHSFFLDNEGGVWACGNNENGQLGFGDKTNRSRPKRLSFKPKIDCIATNNHTLFCDDGGSVWACGSNENGQLGLVSSKEVLLPHKITNIPPIDVVSCGTSHSLFLDFDGFVWGCGNNSTGQLGLGTQKIQKKPVKIPDLEGIKFISAGSTHSLFVDVDRDAWSCGSNDFGQACAGIEKSYSVVPQIVSLPFNIYSAKTRKMKKLFAKLKEGTSDELVPEIAKLNLLEKFGEENYVKNNLLEGRIPFVKWNSILQPILEAHKQFGETIEQLNATLAQQETQLEEITKLVESTREELQKVEERAESTNFYTQLLSPLAAVETELTQSFYSKLDTPELFTTDDVCMFLNYASLTKLLPEFQEAEITGELLVALTKANGLEEIDAMGDILLNKRLEFFCQLLVHKIFLNEEILSESIIWRHMSVENTIKLLHEYQVDLSEDVIRKYQISICQLINLQVNQLRHIFGMSVLDAANQVMKLAPLRKSFKQFLKSTKGREKSANTIKQLEGHLELNQKRPLDRNEEECPPAKKAKRYKAVIGNLPENATEKMVEELCTQNQIEYISITISKLLDKNIFYAVLELGNEMHLEKQLTKTTEDIPAPKFITESSVIIKNLRDQVAEEALMDLLKASGYENIKSLVIREGGEKEERINATIEFEDVEAACIAISTGILEFEITEEKNKN